MATITKGKTFTSGETVEPADMHQLVDSATVTYTTAGDTDDSTLEISGGKFRVKDGGITTAKLNASILFVPAGAVMPFAMNSAPTGWLAADGAAVSRSTYATLFAAISTAHGSGDGSTTFNLPDLRGIFVRGSGAQTISETSYSGTFAVKQGDQNKAHRHFLFNNDSIANTAISASLFAAKYGSVTGSSGLNYQINGSSLEPELAPSSENGGDESRPANIALLYCIKF
jgi:microcystin-dependent protein